MSNCFQSGSQTILQHGEAVLEKAHELLSDNTEGWRIPDWYELNKDFLKSKLPPLDQLEQYWIYHDCGKPFCRTIDEDGRQHFPDHARISAAIWRSLNGPSIIADLIQHDMDMHTIKPADALSYSAMNLAPTLLITALAEIHANADMFGGIESTSFKIKWKALSKLGNALIKRLKETS